MHEFAGFQFLGYFMMCQLKHILSRLELFNWEHTSIKLVASSHKNTFTGKSADLDLQKEISLWGIQETYENLHFKSMAAKFQDVRIYFDISRFDNFNLQTTMSTHSIIGVYDLYSWSFASIHTLKLYKRSNRT